MILPVHWKDSTVSGVRASSVSPRSSAYTPRACYPYYSVAQRPGPSYKPTGINWIHSMYGANDASCTSDGTTSYLTMKSCIVQRLIHRSQAKTGSLWARRQTPTRCTSKPHPTNLHQLEGWWAAFTGVETRLWPTVDHLDPPDLPRHGCNSDRGPTASGGPTVLANDRNGGRLRLNASRHDDDEWYCCSSVVTSGSLKA